MGIVESAVSFMERIAADNSHGYDQRYRWGERGDYDCSSLVITAYQQAGVPVKDRGATYTGNMYSVFTACGFKDVTASVNRANGSGLMRGDVLLNHRDHVAVYCGNGKEVEASINEFGGVTGGAAGDQTGAEILVRPYRNYPWDAVLRYPEAPVDPNKFYFTVEELKASDKGLNVYRFQCILKGRGFYKGALDRSYGEQTKAAVKAFQKAAGLPQTGACDLATWDTMLGLPRNGYTYTVEPRQWSIKRTADVNVLLAQEILKATGYYTAALTWNFNRPLQKSLKAFQKATKKLEVNGKLDVPTLRWLIGQD